VKRQGQSDQVIAVNGGFMEVRKDKVVILAESAELPEQIDLDRAISAKERAEKRLAEANAKAHDTNVKRAELALMRAVNRIDVAERK
jgi:F-type H+-transporting ATPase subunit epsilon